jgi:hypothetical protein
MVWSRGYFRYFPAAKPLGWQKEKTMKKPMTETMMRQNLRRALAPEINIYPIETKTVLGFPDLMLSGFDSTGVLELKTADPRAPLRDHASRNHRTYVLFYTLETYFLIGGPDAMFPCSYKTLDDLLADSQWSGNDLNQLKLIVTS